MVVEGDTAAAVDDDDDDGRGVDAHLAPVAAIPPVATLAPASRRFDGRLYGSGARGRRVDRAKPEDAGV